LNILQGFLPDRFNAHKWLKFLCTGLFTPVDNLIVSSCLLCKRRQVNSTFCLPLSRYAPDMLFPQHPAHNTSRSSQGLIHTVIPILSVKIFFFLQHDPSYPHYPLDLLLSLLLRLISFLERVLSESEGHCFISLQNQVKKLSICEPFAVLEMPGILRCERHLVA
jgi:hypothetical protein